MLACRQYYVDKDKSGARNTLIETYRAFKDSVACDTRSVTWLAELETCYRAALMGLAINERLRTGGAPLRDQIAEVCDIALRIKTDNFRIAAMKFITGEVPKIPKAPKVKALP
ncbi:hypothetical protein A6302_04052 [Methylobrevis pamukkalensis]|uniref:Uncharacterized protein n=1 Tax=Methylobrevis pamukkalensis TaxID=1439726 RepID=A0A1E3GX96_9HYPH|nr:hypothetical protein A6302_04052 [Methylobrevis pamukkalensis]